ncbi:MAG: hypothetical protein KAY24_19025 [Candidatus Eisenbacteria sp.]|nr:hypothetical protein [Candidatus Eisenbacteria bacterium]
MDIDPSLDNTLDLMRYVRLFWRRKAIILLCTVATLCTVLIVLALRPNVYQSSAVLSIEDSRLVSRAVENLMGGIMQSPGGRNAGRVRLDKLAGRIRSRPFLERVIRMLRMNEDPVILGQAAELQKKHPQISRDEMAVRILVSNLQARLDFRSAGAGLYRITVADYSAEGAQLLAQWISELYVDLSSQEALESIRAAHEFALEQRRVYERQLRQSEGALEANRQLLIERALTHGMIREENRAYAEALRTRIADGLSTTQGQFESHSASLSNHGLSADDLPLMQIPEISEVARRLVIALKRGLAERLAGASGGPGDWPPSGYSAIRLELLQLVERAAEEQYADAGDQVQGDVIRFVFSNVDLYAQAEALAALNKAIDTFQQRIGEAPKKELETARLQEQVDSNRRLLQSFQAQLIAADISRAVEITKLGLQMKILDPANLPLSPSRPNRKRIFMMAVLIGPLIGLGVAYLIEMMDPVLRSVEDFSRIVPEPVLGTTPLIGRVLVRRGWFRRYWVALALAMVLLLTGAFFVLRTNLLRQITTTGAPVQIINPDESSNETP